MITVFSICDFGGGRWDALLFSMLFLFLGSLALICRLERLVLLWSRDHAAFTRLLLYAQVVVGFCLVGKLAWTDLNEVAPLCSTINAQECKTFRGPASNIRQTETRFPDSITTDFDMNGQHFQVLFRRGVFHKSNRLANLQSGNLISALLCGPDSKIVKITMRQQSLHILRTSN